jgi:predicted neutral ceramidase superfamily lipid hydrolase
MNTKSLMTLSAMILAMIGISLIFLPNEILDYLELSVSETLQLLMQIIGSFYFAFAILNWMSKGSIIGGIYNRPIAMANLTHFVIAGLALIKGILANPSLSYVIWSIAIIYSIFAIFFGIVAFKHPVDENNHIE